MKLNSKNWLETKNSFRKTTVLMNRHKPRAVDSKNMLEDLLLLQLHKKYVSIYEKKLKANLNKMVNNP